MKSKNVVYGQKGRKIKEPILDKALVRELEKLVMNKQRKPPIKIRAPRHKPVTILVLVLSGEA